MSDGGMKRVLGVAWKNGKVEIRGIDQGELIIKVNLNKNLVSMLYGDFQMCG
jgi:hypothetical protein